MAAEWRIGFLVSPPGRVFHGDIQLSRRAAEDHRDQVRDTMLDVGDEHPIWIESREVQPWSEVAGSRRDNPGFGHPEDAVEHVRRDTERNAPAPRASSGTGVGS